MINKTFIAATDFFGMILRSCYLDFKLRSLQDLRLVFYHGIGDGNSPSMRYLSDEISESLFIRHLDYLQEHYTILSIEEAVLKIKEPIREKPICSISFDDGLRSVFLKAYPHLKRKKIPFTIFINSPVVNNKKILWTHLLSYFIFHYTEKPIKEYCSIEANVDIFEWFRSNFSIVQREKIIGKLAQKFKENPKVIAQNEGLYLENGDMEKMLDFATFYSHTNNHVPLGCLSTEQIIKEIEHNLPKNFISFPFGMKTDYGLNAHQIALSNGHQYVVEVGNGINDPSEVKAKSLLSRVSLGSCKFSNMYSAIELRPLLKHKLQKLKPKMENFRFKAL